MTQEEKDLLIKDLCARLPYGVKVLYENKIFDVEYVCPMYEEVKLDIPETWTISIDEVKPYLFPMSSITEEQMKKCLSTKHKITKASGKFMYLDSPNTINYYYENHFDYLGLIPMGLAEDATDKNIY